MLVLRHEQRGLRVTEILEMIWKRGLKPLKDARWRVRTLGNELAGAIRTGAQPKLERISSGTYRASDGGRPPSRRRL
jgi:hypothetical protein